MQKEVNDLLEELLRLEKRSKKDLKRISEIKDWCKQQGSFSTNKFVCAVGTRSKTCLISMDEATSRLGFDFIEEYSLAKTVSYLVVNVSKKDEEVIK